MKEILFRGKRVDTGEWVYGLPFYDSNWIMNGIEAGPSTGLLYTVIPETISEYIGIDDKCVRNIFEGDIVKTKYGRLCEVIWFESKMYIGWDLKVIDTIQNVIHTMPPDLYDIWYFENLEVVGNRWDNPELMV